MNIDRYNPFGKELDKIDGKNMAILRDVAEGWFVDYKGQTITIKDYAKHMSAFANQYGGWLFVGIDTNDEKDIFLRTATIGLFLLISVGVLRNYNDHDSIANIYNAAQLIAQGKKIE